MMALRKRVDGLMVRAFGDEFVLLDTASNRVHQFNPTASRIWERCDECSPRSMAAELAREYDVDEEQALSDVVKTLDTFRSLNLVVER
jgi:Coenzyme PQQ synthesis protein D (PqqD)